MLLKYVLRIFEYNKNESTTTAPSILSPTYLDKPPSGECWPFYCSYETFNRRPHDCLSTQAHFYKLSHVLVANLGNT